MIADVSRPRRTAAAPALVPRLRVVSQGEIALGPGKCDLLEAIAEHGSLANAARSLEMSYMRAWQLLRTMNAAFRSPLVELERGGRKGGGARLTAAGHEVLRLYREMERASLRATETAWRRLRRRLR
jgi:molybdate transport system regulatory protein